MPTRPGLKIGRILGIPIYLHASWVIIFFLVTLQLAMQFTQEHPHWSATQHWTVGIVTSLLFFASVLFHELAHSVVAQYYKIQVVSITLFIFGGVARIGREPSKAIQEFNIAVAGPLASFFLYGVFYGLTRAETSEDVVDPPCFHQRQAGELQSHSRLSARWRKDLPRDRLGSNQEFCESNSCCGG